MQTKRHHFSIKLKRAPGHETLNAWVPDEGGYDTALARVKADDPLWSDPAVYYHGLVDWFEPIKFEISEDKA